MYPSPNSAGRSDEESRQQSKRTARACDACYKRKVRKPRNLYEFGGGTDIRFADKM